MVAALGRIRFRMDGREHLETALRIVLGRNIGVKEDALALLPIQAQKSNSRVLNFDSQSSRRCADSNL